MINTLAPPRPRISINMFLAIRREEAIGVIVELLTTLQPSLQLLIAGCDYDSRHI